MFTPNALAVAPLIQQSQTPTVIFNAATSAITEKSDFFIRTSYTLWQVTVPLAQWAAQQNIKKVVTAVTRLRPRRRRRNRVQERIHQAGRRRSSRASGCRSSTTDFAPFVQRIKASGAQAVYTFLPGGPPNLGFVKAYNENGLAKAGIQFLGTAETDEFDLQKFGDGALGLDHGLPLLGGARVGRQQGVHRRVAQARSERDRQLRVGRCVGRHVRDPQDDRSDRRQARRREGDRCGYAR